MNSTIDNGQVEGALVQGIGWMTMEELSFAKDGKLLSNSLSTYKVPDIYSAPKNIEITALKTVFVLAVALLVANVVVASGKIKVNLDAKNSETAVVEILNSEMSKIHVQIKDQYGETIYSKKKVAPAESFKTKYN